nr:MAG TPA: hypothetical protein [Siphoviridae sp. ctza41]
MYIIYYIGQLNGQLQLIHNTLIKCKNVDIKLFNNLINLIIPNLLK